MSRLFNTPQQVADVLPKEIADKFLVNFGLGSTERELRNVTLASAIEISFLWALTKEGIPYWENVYNRARAGEFDPKGEEPIESKLNGDVTVVGKCANCGVEYHIHQPTTDIPLPSLDEIKDQVAKELGFQNFFYFYNDDSTSEQEIRNLMTEVAIRHAGYVSAHERQRAERAEAEVAELKAALRGVVRLKPLIKYPDNTLPEHRGEAESVNKMFSEIEYALAEKGGSDGR